MFDHWPVRIVWGRLVINPQAVRVWQDGTPIPLTLRQFETLLSLLAQPHRILRRHDILMFCEEHEPSFHRASHPPRPDERVVDVYVSHLRRKLYPGIVETVRGIGYRLGDPQRDDSASSEDSSRFDVSP